MSEPASRRRRVAGITIDFLVVIIAMMAVILLLSGNNWDDRPSLPKTIPAVVMVIAFAVLICRDAIAGISLGRLLIGTAVRDASNSERIPSLGRLIIRGVFLPLWPVELLVLLARKRRIADIVTRTVVVRHTVPGWTGVRRLGLALGVGVALFFLWRAAGYTAIGRSAAYATAVSYVTQSAMSGTSVRHYSSGVIEILNGDGIALIPLQVRTTTETRSVTVRLGKSQGQPWKPIEVAAGIKNVGLSISMTEQHRFQY